MGGELKKSSPLRGSRPLQALLQEGYTSIKLYLYKYTWLQYNLSNAPTNTLEPLRAPAVHRRRAVALSDGDPLVGGADIGLRLAGEHHEEDTHG